ncbi:MAG: hypothetical protein WC608_03635 [Parcubacteria group bacterium]
MKIEAYVSITFCNLITGEENGVASFTKNIWRKHIPRPGKNVQTKVGGGSIFGRKCSYKFKVRQSGVLTERFGFINLMPEKFSTSFEKEFLENWKRVEMPKGIKGIKYA